MESYERQIRISGKTHGGTLQHAQVLISAAVLDPQLRQFDRAIELASEAVEIASQPENDPLNADNFRNILDSVRRQKAEGAAAGNGRSGKWFNADRFSRPDGTGQGSATRRTP